MKEPQWDDSADDSTEYFDAAVLLSEDEVEGSKASVEPIKPASTKVQFTDLRRRIEERLDSKRIDHEFDYDDLDSSLDHLG